MSQRIAQEAIEQSSTTESISRKLTNLNQGANLTADSARDAARISAELARLGETLAREIAQFKIE